MFVHWHLIVRLIVRLIVHLIVRLFLFPKCLSISHSVHIPLGSGVHSQCQYADAQGPKTPSSSTVVLIIFVRPSLPSVCTVCNVIRTV